MASILTISFIFIMPFLPVSSLAHKVNNDTLHKKSQNVNISGLPSSETVYGDIYDCIDVYNQHSLAHPSLQDHKIKMKPSQEILAAFQRSTNESTSNNLVDKLWKSKKGCPKGTIPVRRTMGISDQKISTNNSSNYLSQSLKWSHGIDFAGIYTKPGKTFYAAIASINLQNPKVHSDQQYSSATIFVESGETSNLNQIQVGWTVNPKLYGDYNTRLYTAWTRDNHQSTGCFNTECPGFVMVNNQATLDHEFTGYISITEGIQYEVALYVYLEPGVGWWFAIGTFSNCIGYWPISLFVTMQESADSLRFGGQVFTAAWEDNSPQMGSGRFVNGEYDKTCNMRRILVKDETYLIKDIKNYYIDATDSRCYYEGDHSFKNEDARFSFVFGGAGGKDGSTCLY